MMMLGSKGILTPLIELLRALALRNSKNIRNPLIFLQKMAASCFGGSQVQKSSCKQACIGFMTFDPGIIISLNQRIQEIIQQMKGKIYKKALQFC